MENLRSSPAMPYIATILITLLLAVPAISVELFQYRGAAKGGGTLECVFDYGEQNSLSEQTRLRVRFLSVMRLTPIPNARHRNSRA
jgi:hypothetical protein